MQTTSPHICFCRLDESCMSVCMCATLQDWTGLCADMTKRWETYKVALEFCRSTGHAWTCDMQDDPSTLHITYRKLLNAGECANVDQRNLRHAKTRAVRAIEMSPWLAPTCEWRKGRPQTRGTLLLHFYRSYNCQRRWTTLNIRSH